MIPRVQTWIVSSALALAALAPASAQSLLPFGGPSHGDYTGVVTPFGYLPPRVPTYWILPQYTFHYEAARPVYVPAARPERPAVEPVRVARLTLDGSRLPADVRLKQGTVATWTNTGEREQTLVIRHLGTVESSGASASRAWRLRANESLSLAFRQPGLYEYYLRDQPEQRARILVEE